MSVITVAPTPTLDGLLESTANVALKRYFWHRHFNRKYRSGTTETVKVHLERLLTYSELERKRRHPRTWIAPIFIPLKPNSSEARMLREILDDRQAARDLAKAAGCQIGMVICLEREGYNFLYGDRLF